MRASTIFLPALIALACIFAYRPLISPESDWSLLHRDYHVFHSHACLKRRISLQCFLWFFDGGAAAQFGVFEPLSLLFHSLLLTLNNNYINFHSWHIISLILHILISITWMFLGESLLAMMDGGKKQLYRVPVFFAVLYWALHPQRVQAILWASAYSVPLSTLLALLSFCCYLRSIQSDIPWRFLSWLLFVMASWASATVLPLAFIYIMIDCLVVLPAYRAKGRENAAKANKPLPAPTTLAENAISDLVRSTARCFVFIAGWSVGFALSNLTHLRSILYENPDDNLVESFDSNLALFNWKFRSLLDVTTLEQKVVRTLVALSWYTRQLFVSHELHLFQTRHVDLSDESVARLFLEENQQELSNVALVCVLIFIAIATFIARTKHTRIFTIGTISFILILLPHTTLFSTPIPGISALYPNAHLYVSDLPAYLASGMLIPYLAYWLLREEHFFDTAAEKPAEKSSASTTTEKKQLPQQKSKENDKESKKSNEAASASSTTAPSTKKKKVPLFYWLAPRLVLTLLLASAGMFALQLTPDEVATYKNLQSNCEHILKLDPRVVECHEILGLTAYRAGQLNAASQYLSKIIDMNTRSLVALVTRGTILAGSNEYPALKNQAESDRSFEYALTISPENSYVLYNWAQVKYRTHNDAAGAMQLLEKVISHDAEFADAYYLLADIAEHIGDKLTADTYRGQADMIQKREVFGTNAVQPDSEREGLIKAKPASDLPARG